MKKTTKTKRKSKTPKSKPGGDMMHSLNAISREREARAIKDGMETRDSIRMSRAIERVWAEAAGSRPGSRQVFARLRGTWYRGGTEFGVKFEADFRGSVVVPEGPPHSPESILWAMVCETEFNLLQLRCGLNHRARILAEKAQGKPKAKVA